MFEFNKIFIDSGLCSLHAKIEWQGVQIPKTITNVLRDIRINLSLINNAEDFDEAPIYYFDRNLDG